MPTDKLIHGELTEKIIGAYYHVYNSVAVRQEGRRSRKRSCELNPNGTRMTRIVRIFADRVLVDGRG